MKPGSHIKYVTNIGLLRYWKTVNCPGIYIKILLSLFPSVILLNATKYHTTKLDKIILRSKTEQEVWGKVLA